MILSGQKIAIMASKRQIEANCRNAQKSRGAITLQGKAASSQNALKTGVDAKSEILPSENPAEHAKLTAEYHTRFAPATPDERTVVDALVRHEWLGRRYMRIEGAIWEEQFNTMDSPCPGAAYLALSSLLGRVSRRQNAAQRDYLRVLKQLETIQATRPASSAQHSATEQVNHELGSFLISPQLASAALSPTTETPQNQVAPPRSAPSPQPIARAAPFSLPPLVLS
jgi:hypothetical protein